MESFPYAFVQNCGDCNLDVVSNVRTEHPLATPCPLCGVLMTQVVVTPRTGPNTGIVAAVRASMDTED